AEQGASWIQIDEPILVTGVDEATTAATAKVYAALAEKKGNARIILNTYFDHVADIYTDLVNLPVDGFGFDLVRGIKTVAAIQQLGFPENKILVAGVVNGRNVWRNDLRTTLSLLQLLATFVPLKHIQVS